MYILRISQKKPHSITNACGAFLLLAVRTGIEPVFPP